MQSGLVVLVVFRGSGPCGPSGVGAQIHLATSTTLVPRPTWPKSSPDPPDYKVHLAQVWPRSTWRPGPLGPSLAQIHLATRSTLLTKVADQIVFTTRSTLSSDPLHDHRRRMATVSTLVYIYIYICIYIYVYIYNRTCSRNHHNLIPKSSYSVQIARNFE